MDAVFKPGGGPDASPPLPKIVVGKKLSRRRKGINPSHLALVAVDLETGRARLSAPLTRRQAIAVTGASAGYVATATRLSAQEREQVEAGKLSLSSVHNAPPSNAAIDKFIVKAGADRVMAGLDRHTQPSLFSVAAEQHIDRASLARATPLFLRAAAYRS